MVFSKHFPHPVNTYTTVMVFHPHTNRAYQQGGILQAFSSPSHHLHHSNAFPSTHKQRLSQSGILHALLHRQLNPALLQWKDWVLKLGLGFIDSWVGLLNKKSGFKISFFNTYPYSYNNYDHCHILHATFIWNMWSSEIAPFSPSPFTLKGVSHEF